MERRNNDYTDEGDPVKGIKGADENVGKDFEEVQASNAAKMIQFIEDGLN
jgi:hypothetical protein